MSMDIINNVAIIINIVARHTVRINGCNSNPGSLAGMGSEL